jgi:[ribosomal protein S5]-alanine N-acetyltransferase
MHHRTFSQFPLLITERLTLRQPVESDGPQMFLLRSDPGVNEYLDRKAPSTTEETLEFIQKVREYFSNETGIYWAITLTGSDQLIGTICLFDFSGETRKCEIGYELLPAYQGQGIMNEALQKVIAFSAEVMGMEIIDAVAHKDNRASARLLEKSGFIGRGVADDADPELVLFRLAGLTSAPAAKQDPAPSDGSHPGA